MSSSVLSVFGPDKTRAASLLNGFKNEPVRISLYKDHNLYTENTNKI